MKYAVIADVAGQYEALMRLISRIPKDYELIFLGDLIDRGPDSDLILEFVINNSHKCVLGNHEHLFYDYYRTHRVHGMYGAISGGMYDRDIWLMNGGHATFKLYTQVPANPDIPRSKHLIEKHLDWVKDLPLSLSLPVDMVVEEAIIDYNKMTKLTGKSTRFTELMVTHAPLHTRLGDREIDEHKDFSDWTKLERSILWNRSAPKRREYFQLNGHNSHWGLQVYDDDEGFYGWCLDDSRRQRLTAMLIPEQTIIQESYNGVVDD